MNFPENYLFVKTWKPHILRICGEGQFGAFSPPVKLTAKFSIVVLRDVFLWAH